MEFRADVALDVWEAFPGAEHAEEEPERGVADAASLQIPSTCFCGTVPQVIFSADASQVTILKPAPPKRGLVLQGGGFRGAAMPSFLRTLEQCQPFLEGLTDIAGSSSGSTLGLLLATGVSLDSMEEELDGARVLKEIRVKSKTTLTEADFGRGLIHGGGVIDRIMDLVLRELQEWAGDVEALEERLAAIEEIAGQRLFETHRHNFIDSFEEGFERGVTFRDLAILHELDPGRFKRLHVTGFDVKRKEPVYFSAKTTPDVFCHVAVRGAIALPVLFSPIRIEGRLISDGAEGSNIPTEMLLEEAGGHLKREETLTLVFDAGGQATRTLYDPAIVDYGGRLSQIVRPLTKRCDKLQARLRGRADGKSASKKKHGDPVRHVDVLYGGKRLREARKEDSRKIYEAGPTAAIVGHAKLNVVGFAASKESVHRARLHARETAMDWAGFRDGGEAIHETFDSVTEAIAWLSDDEVTSLYASMNGGDQGAGRCDEKLRAALEARVLEFS